MPVEHREEAIAARLACPVLPHYFFGIAYASQCYCPRTPQNPDSTLMMPVSTHFVKKLCAQSRKLSVAYQ